MDHNAIWQANLHDEVAFWRRWLTDPEFGPHRDYRMNSCRLLFADMVQLLPPNQAVYSILDVGSGPVSILGTLIPGKHVNLFMVDSLADEYSQILDELNVRDAIRAIKVDGENLTTVFPRAFFDLVVCANALDHCYDPLVVIREMVAVCRPGGYVHLSHLDNEAEHERYTGLHQWNLTVDEGRFILWSREKRIDIWSEIAEIANIKIIQYPATEILRDSHSVLLQRAGVR
jgi:SAM-dependent methyltransferase